MKRILLFLFTIQLLNFSVAGQESILKDYAEKNRRVNFLYPICLYPSTLRMVNLTNDPLYNDFISDIKKVLVYQLDSAQLAGDHTSWIKEYEKIGFEEFISLYGPQTIKIVGKEEELVGLVKSEGISIAFYVDGTLPLGKIPEMINSFQNLDLIGVLKDGF